MKRNDCQSISIKQELFHFSFIMHLSLIFFILPKYYQDYYSSVFYISFLLAKLNKQFMSHAGKSPQRLCSLKRWSTSMTQIGNGEWKLSVLLLSRIHLDLGTTKNIPSWWLLRGLREGTRRYQLLQVSRLVFGTCLSRDQCTSQPSWGTASRTELDLCLNSNLWPSKAPHSTVPVAPALSTCIISS